MNKQELIRKYKAQFNCEPTGQQLNLILSSDIPFDEYQCEFGTPFPFAWDWVEPDDAEQVDVAIMKRLTG